MLILFVMYCLLCCVACFVFVSIRIQLRRRIVATSGNSGCEISSVISLQLGYLLIYLRHLRCCLMLPDWHSTSIILSLGLMVCICEIYMIGCILTLVTPIVWGRIKWGFYGTWTMFDGYLLDLYGCQRGFKTGLLGESPLTSLLNTEQSHSSL